MKSIEPQEIEAAKSAARIIAYLDLNRSTGRATANRTAGLVKGTP
jgi:hypothetical protein